MIRFFLYFILLILFVWIGILIYRDPGYILITYQHWSLETTLWFAIIAIIVIYLLLYLLIKILGSTFFFPQKLRIWSKKHREQKSDSLTYKGLCELAEGEWKKAENDLIKGAKYTPTPLINYLGAAHAAQQQKKYEARDNYLSLAHQSSPQAEIATGLTQAQLQFNARQWELALATLRHLNTISPSHSYVLKLLKNLYLKLKDWKSLQAMIPDLRKYKVVSAEEILHLEELTYSELLKAANAQNPQQLSQLWEKIPRNLHTDPSLVIVYAEFLCQHQEPNKAEIVVREALKKSWHPLLLNLYGKIKTDTPDKHLLILENWLKTHPKDPDLLIALGRVAVQNQLWGKAKDYFNASIELQPKREAYVELGKLYENLNDTIAAMESYRKALEV